MHNISYRENCMKYPRSLNPAYSIIKHFDGPTNKWKNELMSSPEVQGNKKHYVTKGRRHKVADLWKCWKNAVNLIKIYRNWLYIFANEQKYLQRGDHGYNSEQFNFYCIKHSQKSFHLRNQLHIGYCIHIFLLTSVSYV